MDWGIAFSTTPSRVKVNTATAFPFFSTVIVRELAVNAHTGAIQSKSTTRHKTGTLPMTGGYPMDAAGLIR
jgi:hypothetical protein